MDLFVSPHLTLHFIIRLRARGLAFAVETITVHVNVLLCVVFLPRSVAHAEQDSGHL